MDYSVLKPVFEGKRAVILGYGREGRVWLDILRKLSCCAEIAVADMNEVTGAEGCVLHTGEDYLARAAGYDIILQSPGVIIKDALSAEQKSKILTQTELLLRLRPCEIIGVTGTKGKSTVSSLIHHFLKACGRKTMLIGNIGVPPLERLEEMTPDTAAVCEMSCHQLEFAKHSPQVAVLLNIFPEHLDHYVSYEAYAAAKKNIYLHQRAGDCAVINSDIQPEPFGGELITAAFGKPADISSDGESISLWGEVIERSLINTRLRGRHNMYNIAAALAAAVRAGADLNTCLRSLPDFEGLPHRLEYVASIDGVEYINDSICTIPEAAIAAVNAFPDGADCVIIGGMDRGIPYDKLTDFLNTGAVKNVILLPDTGARITKDITNPAVNAVRAADLPDAVRLARELARKRVILCPAAASYGFYKNFEERGNHFKQLVVDSKQ